MDLWWDDQDKQALLYVGLYDTPVASIAVSNGGVMYSYLIDVPISTQGWKRYMHREPLKQTIEKAVRSFFDTANTSRPATDRVGEG